MGCFMIVSRRVEYAGNRTCGAGNDASTARDAARRIHGLAEAKGDLGLVTFALSRNYVVALVRASANTAIAENTCIVIHLNGMGRAVLPSAESSRSGIGSFRHSKLCN